jgi:hypothetical protein
MHSEGLLNPLGAASPGRVSPWVLAEDRVQTLEGVRSTCTGWSCLTGSTVPALHGSGLRSERGAEWSYCVGVAPVMRAAM